MLYKRAMKSDCERFGHCWIWKNDLVSDDGSVPRTATCWRCKVVTVHKCEHVHVWIDKGLRICSSCGTTVAVDNRDYSRWLEDEKRTGRIGA